MSRRTPSTRSIGRLPSPLWTEVFTVRQWRTQCECFSATTIGGADHAARSFSTWIPCACSMLNWRILALIMTPTTTSWVAGSRCINLLGETCITLLARRCLSLKHAPYFFLLFFPRMSSSSTELGEQFYLFLTCCHRCGFVNMVVGWYASCVGLTETFDRFAESVLRFRWES